jgi:hypothetical protein
VDVSRMPRQPQRRHTTSALNQARFCRVAFFLGWIASQRSLEVVVISSDDRRAAGDIPRTNIGNLSALNRAVYVPYPMLSPASAVRFLLAASYLTQGGKPHATE